MKLLSELVGVSVSIVAFVAAVSAQASPVVPKWQPYDFAFIATNSPANPFLISFSAVVIGPDGRTFSTPGFFDGDRKWKIRVSADCEGHWSLLTSSDYAALDRKTAEWDCAANTNKKVHGVLRVDSMHPHHFIFEDGSRFFMQAYEYDWLWALDMDKGAVPTVEKTLDLISEYGFDYVILNSYAYDTKWRPGRLGPDDYGPALLYPWEGDNDHPLQSRMNIAYWRHYDQVMTALCDRGMEAHMLIKVYNKQVHWPEHGSVEEQLFFRWLVARYAAYPNLIWDFSKEAHNEKDIAYKQGWLKYIRSTDPYHHLVTVHDDDHANDSGAYDELTDFRADQQHSHYHATILRQRARRDWPVANVESDYECGPGGGTDKTYGTAETTDQTLRTLWEIAMAGGYTAYYYTYTAWDVIHPLDVPPGYAGMKHFGDFWRGVHYWLMQPADRLTSEGWCLADEGCEYIVYLNHAKSFTLEIKGAGAPLSAEWFNPFTGNVGAASQVTNGMVRFEPPATWGDSPLILHLRSLSSFKPHGVKP